mmetsp:Transcript_29583/g.73981  ORF Transcript_29583/g.73981 Transcript_29583/m.73981 type:complete len:204 (+) Transcript_29583:1201-1812(+)
MRGLSSAPRLSSRASRTSPSQRLRASTSTRMRAPRSERPLRRRMLGDAPRRSRRRRGRRSPSSRRRRRNWRSCASRWCRRPGRRRYSRARPFRCRRQPCGRQSRNRRISVLSSEVPFAAHKRSLYVCMPLHQQVGLPSTPAVTRWRPGLPPRGALCSWARDRAINFVTRQRERQLRWRWHCFQERAQIHLGLSLMLLSSEWLS